MNEYRVFGPPGTGKTTTLARWVNQAAEQYGSEKVLVASFTRAAAAEISSRDLPIPPEHVGTLHALAYRSLGSKIDIAESHLDDWNKAHAQAALSVEADTAKQLEAGYEVKAGSTYADGLFMQQQVLRARRIPRERWPRTVLDFDKQWIAWKQANNLLDFTDLIEQALERTYSAPGRPAVGFFDEVQDFTPLELALVRHWGSKMEWGTVMAGDDDQCLYDFKGCTPDAFLDPPVDADHKRVLGQSFRVPRTVHRYASEWVARLRRREPKEYLPRDDDGAALWCEASIDSLYVRDMVERYVADGKTVMLLTTCAYMLVPVIHALRETGMPFHNPYRRTRGDWNPLRSSRGTSAAQKLMAYLAPQADSWNNPDDCHMWSQRELHAWVQALAVKGNLLPHCKDDLAAVCNRPGDGYTEVPIPGLLKMFTEPALGAALDGDLDWYLNNLLASAKPAMAFPMQVIKRRGAKVLRVPPKVVVGTIHSVKGGEADVVIMSPDVSPQGYAAWHGNSEQHDAVIRQMYVAATRARETLIITAPSGRYSVPLPRYAWMPTIGGEVA